VTPVHFRTRCAYQPSVQGAPPSEEKGGHSSWRRCVYGLPGGGASTPWRERNTETALTPSPLGTPWHGSFPYPGATSQRGRHAAVVVRPVAGRLLGAAPVAVAAHKVCASSLPMSDLAGNTPLRPRHGRSAPGPKRPCQEARRLPSARRATRRGDVTHARRAEAVSLRNNIRVFPGTHPARRVGLSRGLSGVALETGNRAPPGLLSLGREGPSAFSPPTPRVSPLSIIEHPQLWLGVHRRGDVVRHHRGDGEVDAASGVFVLLLYPRATGVDLHRGVPDVPAKSGFPECLSARLSTASANRCVAGVMRCGDCGNSFTGPLSDYAIGGGDQ
jgi:hypothetical protein